LNATDRPPLGTFGRSCAWAVLVFSVLVGVFAPLKHGDTWFDRVAVTLLIDAAWIYILIADARRRR
jgi:hypothetical protein